MKIKEKKVVLITGGSRGIGKALVEKFKKQGWLVATCATHLDHLSESVADLNFKCNVTDSTEVKAGISNVLQSLGQLDALINNAGLAGTNLLEPDAPSQVSDDLWNAIINVNLHGTYFMCKNAIPHLPDQTGKIINIASVLALKGVPDATAYCAAKHGVLGLTRALAQYLAPRRITVNAICPGWVRTDMATERMQEIGITEEDLKKQVPLGAMIEPDQIADLAYFLASSDASLAMTGQALSIDGGVTP